MYLKKLTIENIRALKRFELTFPENPAGWHVLIGNNGSGKSTVIRAISLGLIGPIEVRAARPDFAEWLRKGEKRASVEVVVARDLTYDGPKNPDKDPNPTPELVAKVALSLNTTMNRLPGETPLIDVEGENQETLTNFLWGNAPGWFSAGFGAFRRFTGGDDKRGDVYQTSPRCGAHLSVFGEDVALTEALKWFKRVEDEGEKFQAKAEETATTSDAITVEDSGPDAVVAKELESIWNLATQLKERSLFLEAELLYRRALEQAEAHFGPDHPLVSTALNNLGQLLQDVNRLDEAEPLMRRALAINEASFGANHSTVTVFLNNLAQLLQVTNRLAEAEPLMRRALRIGEASFSPDHPIIATSLNNLAGLLRATNRWSEAEPLYRRALAIDEISFGSEHPNVAAGLNNLAQLLKATNRLKEAESLMQRALKINETSFGPNHPIVALSINNLAQLLKATNRLTEAEPLMRRVLAIDEAHFGPSHPTVATALNNLAALLQATNQWEEAEPLMRRALVIDEASFGSNHPNVARDLNNLARLLQNTNRREEAELLMRRALAIDEASFGHHHPNVAVRLSNLADLLLATNRLGEAEPLIRQALAIDEASFGLNHPDVATDLNNLASLLYATNRLKEAEPLMRRALAIDESSFGPDHPNVALYVNNLAFLLRADNREREAQELVTQYKTRLAAEPRQATQPTVALPPPTPVLHGRRLAQRLVAFINESDLLPSGITFRGITSDGPVFRDGYGQDVAVTQLSDGFRSVLSLAFELIRQLVEVYGQERVFPVGGAPGVIELPGVVLIDEVDIHLHPTWQTSIGQKLTRCFPKLQFVVTTHSPLICRAVTETTGSIWRLPTPGQGEQVEEVTGVERDRLRLGTVLDAYGTGLFGGPEVEQSADAVRELEEMAELDGKQLFGKTTPEEDQRLKVLRQRFSTYDTTTNRRA